ncbi:MAG: mechanosensitive ion channel [Caulobacter sp.]|nr:mechanosensitive ion channel [Caulobacter sp.]
MLEDLAGLTGVALITLGRSTVTVGGVVTALSIIIVAMIASRLVQAGLRKVRHKVGRNVGSIYIVEKLSTYGLVIFGIVAGLSTMGLNLSSLAVFAGALGVGVGLGLQGVVKEFVSGLVLIFDRVLNIGDYIEIENGTRGLVQEIGPRATRIRTNDNIDILVPNSRLIENPVTNWTLNDDTRRIHIPFGVAYGVDKDKVRLAAMEAAQAVPFTLYNIESRKPQVWLIGFGDSSLNFELVVWPTLDAAKRPQSMHAAYTWAIDDALRRHNIEIPFPQRDIRIRSLFGEEGGDALKALRLEREDHAAPADRVATSPNDAAEDLVRSVREETPPDPKP